MEGELQRQASSLSLWAPRLNTKGRPGHHGNIYLKASPPPIAVDFDLRMCLGLVVPSGHLSLYGCGPSCFLSFRNSLRLFLLIKKIFLFPIDLLSENVFCHFMGFGIEGKLKMEIHPHYSGISSSFPPPSLLPPFQRGEG